MIFWFSSYIFLLTFGDFLSIDLLSDFFFQFTITE